MNPEQVKAYVQSEYQHLHIESRTDPDGFSFYLTPPRKGANPNRIFRVLANVTPDTAALKLAVSNRLNRAKSEFVFSGTRDELRKLIDTEIQLYKEHFDS